MDTGQGQARGSAAAQQRKPADPGGRRPLRVLRCRADRRLGAELSRTRLLGGLGLGHSRRHGKSKCESSSDATQASVRQQYEPAKTASATLRGPQTRSHGEIKNEVRTRESLTARSVATMPLPRIPGSTFRTALAIFFLPLPFGPMIA